eukprot:CAMPEP_0180814946 /NCGR_PEP_ID=MMETSP1038_2-20121128/67343_1 /TAXON_ID=632150 /ORGANISM="Azadinium spinosum, Strain 3D9" /LENGTH=91 /DNA_ID=CAMNT_0022856645 /DNA_START=412 /DNA_END=684 /DNA_ORIENTATION=+
MTMDMIASPCARGISWWRCMPSSGTCSTTWAGGNAVVPPPLRRPDAFTLVALAHATALPTAALPAAALFLLLLVPHNMGLLAHRLPAVIAA